jgi:hypothetical protein
MGTLFSQSPRNYFSIDNGDIKNEIVNIKLLAKDNGLTFDQVSKVIEILEKRRSNNIYCYDGDSKDEQLAGFGELIKEFINKFKNK